MHRKNGMYKTGKVTERGEYNIHVMTRDGSTVRPEGGGIGYSILWGGDAIRLSLRGVGTGEERIGTNANAEWITQVRADSGCGKECRHTRLLVLKIFGGEVTVPLLR
jgi:hypothetical protein